MTLVLDASAVVDLLLRSTSGERVRTLLTSGDEAVLLTAAHLDAEVLSGLARLFRAGELGAEEVTELIERLGTLAMTRLPITADLLRAAWSLRENIAARDALYVALAKATATRLVTTDDRLARAVPDLAAELPAS